MHMAKTEGWPTCHTELISLPCAFRRAHGKELTLNQKKPVDLGKKSPNQPFTAPSSLRRSPPPSSPSPTKTLPPTNPTSFPTSTAPPPPPALAASPWPLLGRGCARRRRQDRLGPSPAGAALLHRATSTSTPPPHLAGTLCLHPSLPWFSPSSMHMYIYVLARFFYC